MLATLETGIEGGKWFRLVDKVWSLKNLGGSLEKVVAKGGSVGIDNQSARQIEAHKSQTIAKLEQELRASQYEPQAVKRVWIPKPGSNEKRPLGVPTLRDRIVQGALLHVMEPIFERDFAPQSYGFRPGKGCKDALRRVDELLKRVLRIIWWLSGAEAPNPGQAPIRHKRPAPLSRYARGSPPFIPFAAGAGCGASAGDN